MLVTVYMPTKDRLPQLRRAVASVLAQTYTPFELIVTNDGSTDGTRAYLDALVRHHPQVRTIHHDRPRGAPASRNAAIRLAAGNWVTGLDDDDEFVPERIESFVRETQRLDAAGIRYGGLYSQELIVSPRRRYMLAKKAEVALPDLFRYNHIGNQLFARRSTFVDAGLFDETMPAWQDLELFMRVVGLHGPARLVPGPLYVLADDDRADRISKKKKALLLEAYERIVHKWPGLGSASRQQLYLQLLAPFYGFPVEASDVRRYFGMGVSLPACAWFARLMLKRSRAATS